MNIIAKLHKEWRGLQPLKPELQRRMDQQFMVDFNYNSNHLEGNTLTYGQTKLLLLFGRTEVRKFSLVIPFAKGEIMSFSEINVVDDDPEKTIILKVSQVTIKRDLQQLKNNGIIERIGSERGGYWKIIKNYEIK